MSPLKEERPLAICRDHQVAVGIHRATQVLHTTRATVHIMDSRATLRVESDST